MTAVEIPLSRGLVAMVSEQDAEAVSARRWHATKHKGDRHYAASFIDGRSVYMHRLLLGVQGRGREIFVDHINHDGLDNRRENLRLVSPAENARNRKDWKSYVGTRGAFRQGDGWVARIDFRGHDIYLGFFPTEREAGIAYAAAERALMKVCG